AVRDSALRGCARTTVRSADRAAAGSHPERRGFASSVDWPRKLAQRLHSGGRAGERGVDATRRLDTARLVQSISSAAADRAGAARGLFAARQAARLFRGYSAPALAVLQASPRRPADCAD